MKYKLHCFAQSGNAYKAALMLNLCSANWELSSSIAPLRYLRAFTDQGETEVTAFLHARGTAALNILENRVARSDFVVDNEPTVADISLCGYRFWPEEAGFNWSDYPAIEAWLERIKTLPAWVHPYELMPGHPLVQEA